MKKIIFTLATAFLLFTSVSAQAGFCQKWEPAEYVKFFEDGSLWCFVNNNWNPYHVVEWTTKLPQTRVPGFQCCVDWRE